SSLLHKNREAIDDRRKSTLIHFSEVKTRLAALHRSDEQRQSDFKARQKKQRLLLGLPDFPTTTIGSFPQTDEVRSWRARWKKGILTDQEYNNLIRDETEKAIKWQEEIGIDVLVHGEFERNDMVEYFGEQLGGFTFSQNGWV